LDHSANKPLHGTRGGRAPVRGAVRRERNMKTTGQQRDNPYLKEAFLEVVENQLRDNDPPETKETLTRLIAAGHSDPRQSL